MASETKLWFRSVLAYTLAGCVSSTLMGAVLGAIGDRLAGEKSRTFVFCLIGLLSLLLAAREWELISFPLPERKRQTEKFWVHDFGFVVASAMWGLHIGLGFFTRVTYGGFWVLVAVALALGDPVYGAALMLVYWLGRALPLWIAPALLGSDSDAIELPEKIFDHRLVYHRMVGLTLVWSAVITALLALAQSR